MLIVSSNERKLREYDILLSEMGFDIKTKKIKDIPEIKTASPALIMIYKAKEILKLENIDSLDDIIVFEDATVEIGGEAITDIKYKIEEYKKNYKANNEPYTKMMSFVYLGVLTKKLNKLEIYVGVESGSLIPPHKYISDKNAFGFDNIFIPNDTTHTLHEIKKSGNYKTGSARYLAFINMLHGTNKIEIDLDSFSNYWTGDYQGGVI